MMITENKTEKTLFNFKRKTQPTHPFRGPSTPKTFLNTAQRNDYGTTQSLFQIRLLGANLGLLNLPQIEPV
jgi:hypothetical protein